MTGSGDIIREACKAAAPVLAPYGQDPDVVEDVVLAALRVALPMHETQHADALRDAAQRAVHFELALFRKEEQLAKMRTSAGDVTDAMVAAAWEVFGRERAPYMARIANFTRERIDNGEWAAANQEADALNDDVMRRTIVAAVAVAPWYTGEALNGVKQ